MFRSFSSSLLFLLDLALLHLFGFVLFGSRFLRFAGNLLIGLGLRLTLRFELIKSRLNDWLDGGSSGVMAKLTKSIPKMMTCSPTANMVGQ